MEYRSKGATEINFLVKLALAILAVATLYTIWTSAIPVPKEVMQLP